MGEVIAFPEVKRVRCACGWRPPVMRTWRADVDTPRMSVDPTVVAIARGDAVFRFTIGYACPDCGAGFTTTFGGEAD